MTSCPRAAPGTVRTGETTTQVRAEGTAGGRARARHGPFQGGDEPEPGEALPGALTLEDKYVFC